MPAICESDRVEFAIAENVGIGIGWNPAEGERL